MTTIWMSTSRGLSDDGWCSDSMKPATTFEEDENIARTRLISLYPRAEFKRLPRAWNKNDKYHFLDISHCSLRVSYKGNGKQQQKDAASTRADYPIPSQCGVYYFEITIVRGLKGCMGVGVCGKSVNLNRLPGESYRNICVTSVATLGIASRDLEHIDDLYPTIGLQTTGEVVDANFGQKPFRFDIRPEMEAARARVSNEILSVQLPPEKTDWMNRIVSSWMACEGYSKSMASFCNAAKLVPEEGEQSIEMRKEIVALVLSRRSKEAISKMEEAYPDIFVLNKNIALVLKCQQFVEMAAEIARLDSLSNPVTTTSSNGQSVPSVQSPRSAYSHLANPHKRTYGKYADSNAEDIEAPPARRTPPFTDNEIAVQSDIQMEEDPCSSTDTHLSPRNGHITAFVKNGHDSTDGVSAYDGVVFGAGAGTTIIEEESAEDGKDVGAEDGVLHNAEAVIQAVDSVFVVLIRCNLKCSQESLATICLIDYSQFESHHLLSEEHLTDLSRQTASAILEFGGRSAESQLSRYFHLWSKMQAELSSAKIPHCAFADVSQLVFGHNSLSTACTTSPSAVQDDSTMVVG
ncbi:SPRY domain protein [Dictyocaulus viviparus]|uniref:SPRY domain protein n=1 Tax=Dictyocaulus viviparus TaxID=29172 RepID=A0A0D8XK82_DICVI|nr:SPRY domain protein [Dictyocaulus viviparus]